MICIIVFVVAFIVTYVAFSKMPEEVRAFEGNSGKYMPAIFIAVVAAIVVEMAAYSITEDSCEITDATLTSSQEIIALSDTSSQAGEFFLGCGSVNSEEYYVYYVQREHGFIRQKLRADSTSCPTYINYTSSDEAPRIDTYTTVIKLEKKPHVPYSIFSFFRYLGINEGDVIKETDDISRVEFYIPEGSIRENYVVDME